MKFVEEWRKLKDSPEQLARRDLSAPRTQEEVHAAWYVAQAKLHLLKAKRNGTEDAITQCKTQMETVQYTLDQARDRRIAQAQAARDGGRG